MRVMVKLLALSLITSASPALAGECSRLLDNGVHDKTLDKGYLRKIRHVQNVICRSDYQDYQRAQSIGLDVTLPIGEALVPFGFTGSSETYKSARSKFCSLSSDYFEGEQAWLTKVSQASQALIDGFVECMKTATYFDYWIEATSPETFAIVAASRGLESGAKLKADILITPASIRPNCEGLQQFKKGAAIGVGGVRALCTRKRSDAVSVALSTDVQAATDIATLGPFREEKPDIDARYFESTTGSEATIGPSNKWAREVCLERLPGYVFDTTKSRVVIEDYHDDTARYVLAPDTRLSVNEPTRVCGQALMRPGGDGYRYRVSFHVDAFGTKHRYSYVDSAKVADPH
jgi:hypothetical protein